MSIKIKVYERAGKPVPAYPVSFVLPLPRGRYHETPSLALFGPDNKAIPVYYEVVSRWWSDPDRSLRFVKYTFMCEGLAPKGVRTYTLRDGNPRLIQDETTKKITDPETYETTLREPSVFVRDAGIFLNEKAFSLDRGIAWDKANSLFHHREYSSKITPDLLLKVNQTNYRSLGIEEYDILLTNTNLNVRQGKAITINKLALFKPSDVAAATCYRSKYFATGQEDNKYILAENHTLYDLNGLRRKVLYLDKADPNMIATFQLPPVAVVDPVWYATCGEGPWAFEEAPIAHTTTPKLVPTYPAEISKPTTFRLVNDPLRWKRSNGTGGWPYPDARFVATGDPAFHEQDLDEAIAETILLPQAIFDYVHDLDWERVGLDEAPYGSGSWRSFSVVRNPASYSARDSQHGWHYHVAGAWRFTGDWVLREWLKAAGQMRIAELKDLTRFPSDSERAVGHSLALALQSYEVNGDQQVLDACRTRIRQLVKRKDVNRRLGRGFISFRTGFLLRALIAFMRQVDPNDPDYWTALKFVARCAETTYTYSKFAHQISVYDVERGTVPKSGISNLTMVDPVLWYAFHFQDPKAWKATFDYLGGKLGSRPTGKWDKWEGQYEGAVYHFVKGRKPSFTEFDPPALLEPQEPQNDHEYAVAFPEEMDKYLVVYSKRPINLELSPDAATHNWWDAATLVSGTKAKTFTFSLEPRDDGQPWYVAIIGWNSYGRSRLSATLPAHG